MEQDEHQVNIFLFFLYKFLCMSPYLFMCRVCSCYYHLQAIYCQFRKYLPDTNMTLVLNRAISLLTLAVNTIDTLMYRHMYVCMCSPKLCISITSVHFDRCFQVHNSRYNYVDFLKLFSSLLHTALCRQFFLCHSALDQSSLVAP